MRLFHTEHKLGGVKEEWFSQEDGTIHRKLTQKSDGVVGAVAGMREHARGKNQYYLGSVPIVIAQQWARECGASIGTQEFVEYAKKKLMDGSHAKLSSGIRV